MKISTGSYIIISLSCILILFIYDVRAQEMKWTTVEGLAAMDNTGKSEAKKKAMDSAMQKAVLNVVGESISAETLAINLRLSGGLMSAIPYGKVAEKTVLEEGEVNVHNDQTGKMAKMYRVKIKAGVVEQRSEDESSLSVESALNKSYYKDGDDMVLKIRPSKNSYLAVFVIMEDNSVLRMIPNKYSNSNYVRSGDTFVFPSMKDRASGISLKAHVPEGKKAVSELLYVVALQKPIKFISGIQEGIYGLYKGQSAFIDDLIKEVVTIPLNERAEHMVQYQISK
jgi:hypothetical protein